MKFTLIEVMLVIAIISFIAGMLVHRARKRKASFANIGEGTRETGHWSGLWDATTASTLATVLTTNAVSGGRFLLVKKSTDGDHITTCTTNDVSIGICQDAYDANNTDVLVNVALHGAAPGTQRVVTDGTITDGLPVKCGTSGQATAATTGDAGIFGRAFMGTDETGNANDVITVVTDVPFKASF